jgi:DNA invertase Pin-like site-specific DNA recombinase
MAFNGRIADLGIDTGSATGELVLNLLGAVAQFERQMMLERQREGIAKAKSEGKYKGRKPTARAKVNEIKELRASGMGQTEIAKELGIGRTSVYRVLSQVDGASWEEQRRA